MFILHKRRVFRHLNKTMPDIAMFTSEHGALQAMVRAHLAFAERLYKSPLPFVVTVYYQTHPEKRTYLTLYRKQLGGHIEEVKQHMANHTEFRVETTLHLANSLICSAALYMEFLMPRILWDNKSAQFDTGYGELYLYCGQIDYYEYVKDVPKPAPQTKDVPESLPRTS